jgi:autotransporter-associated beta strand protein
MKTKHCCTAFRVFAGLFMAVLATTAQAATYNWNLATDGTWDTSSDNWSVGGTKWVDDGGNTAVFNNTNLPLRITVNEARTMGNLTVGSTVNYGNYTFDGTGGGSLTVTNTLTSANNGSTTSPVGVITNLNLTVGGDLKVGRSRLVISGSSTVTVSGKIQAADDWGFIEIQTGATVTASNGVDSLTKFAGLYLNGGTLITKYISTRAGNYGSGDSTLYLNGTTMKPMLSTNEFLKDKAVAYGYINAGGAIFDSSGYDIGVGMNLLTNSVAGGVTKLGAGSLTLYGTNTYAGVTTINNGTLVFSNATAFGSGGNITFGGGTLKYGTGFTTDLAARIKNSTGAVSIDDNGQSITNAGPIDSSNTGGLVKAGAGKWTLSGENAYAGVTIISNGTLSFASSAGGIGTASYTTNTSYTFSAAGGNLLVGLSPSFTNNPSAGADGSGPVTLLTDGNVSLNYTVGNNAVLTYTVGSANAGCAIFGINLYTGPWGGGGREDITISNIMYSTVSAPSTFVAIPNSALNYSVGSGSKGFAGLAASGGLLASDVYAIQFNFGPQENNYVGYKELEVIGVRAGILQNSTNVNLTASGAVLDLTNPTSLSTNTTVRLVTGSSITLDNAGTNTISELYINGKAQNKGLYSASALPAYFSGSGYLRVTTVSIPFGTIISAY